MKSVCPCCHQELNPPSPVSEEMEDMSGLFSCDHCQSVLKWEDESLKAVYESKHLASPSNDVESVSTYPDENVFEGVNEANVEGAKDDNLVEIESNIGNVINDSDEEGSLVEQPDPEEKILSEGEQEEVSPEFLESSSEYSPMKEELNAEFIEEEKKISPDFSDVAEHGNAQATSEKGFLRYDLCIAGVDSVEIEQQVLSVLEDPRFQWDAKKIVQSQKEGVLVIKNLNPIKAMCLVSDLSFVPVELSWKQYMALNMSKSQES